MIIKYRKKSLKLRTLEALLARIHPHHPKKSQIEHDLAKEIAGYRGEEAINYHLTFLPTEKYYILHDLRLKDSLNRYFQLDSLLITSEFLMILEVKNISGKLHIKREPNQLVRTINQKTEYYQDPILQVNRQTIQLKNWLQLYHFPQIPILSLVIFTSSTAIIEIEADYLEAREKVIHTEAIPWKVEEAGLNYKQVKLRQKEINKLSSLLVKVDEPLDTISLETYNLNVGDLIKGVRCPNCLKTPMLRKRGKWHCPSCTTNSKNAHVTALEEYALLINPTLTNKEIRSFLQLASRSVSSKLLKRMNLPSSGQNKSCKYNMKKI